MHPGRRLLSLTVLLTALAGPAQARELRIAVLDIRALGTDAAKAELLSEVALTEAASMGGFDVIGKSDIASVIGFEKQRQVMGCTEDSNCLAEIGGALGVDLILVGSLGTLGDLYRLDLKLVDAKKARVRSRIGVTVEGKESRLVAAIQKAVRDLLGPLRQGEEKVAAKEPPPNVDAKVEAKAPPPDERKPDLALSAKRDAEPPAAPAAGSSRRRWGYITGGAGLALLAGGAVAGLQARAALDDEKAASASGDLAAYDDNKAKAKSMSLVADGLFVVGAVGVGVGGWLWFTGAPSDVAVGVVPLPGGALASISGGF